MAGPKAESARGGCPLLHPPPMRPRGGPGPPRPTRTGSRCRKPYTTGFVFWASPPPRRPLQPQCAVPRPCSGCGQTTARPRGRRRGARGAAGTQRALCGAAGRLRSCTHTPGRGPGPRNPGAQGSGGGTAWATSPVAWGRAHTADGGGAGGVGWSMAPCSSLLGPLHLIEMKGDPTESLVQDGSEGRVESL